MLDGWLGQISERSRFVLRLDDASNAEVVGGKFSCQSRLASEGFRVPAFVCIPAPVYQGVFQELAPDVRRLVESDADAGSVSADIEKLFCQVSLPPGLEQALAEAVDELPASGELFAVRASMVGERPEESEDSVVEPFAGLSHTALFVPRERILAEVRRCWASGFSAEAMLYRRERGLSVSDFSVAVGIQQMAFGTRSFVLFTCNPQTFSRQNVVIAGHGIGAGVVEERVPVDHYFVDSETSPIRKDIAHKDVMMQLDPAKGHGLMTGPVAPPLRDTPCLTDHQIRDIVAMGKRVESILGGPQDIEGTITEDGETYVLQSRPVQRDVNALRVWSNANVSESFPGQTTPLTFSVARHFYALLNYDYLRRCGVSSDERHRIRLSLGRMLGYLDGRIYHCITAFEEVNAVNPLLRSRTERFETDVAELLDSYACTDDNVHPPAAVSRWAEARAHGIAAANLFRLSRDFASFERWWTERRDGLNESLGRPMPALARLAEYQAVWREVADHWGVTLINYQYMIFFNDLAKRLLKKATLSEAAADALLSDLLCGGESLAGVEVVLSAVRLGERVSGDPDLSARFKAQSPKDLCAALQSGELSPEFTAEVEGHLARYGDRGLQELKLEVPNLRDTPEELLHTVGSYARRNLKLSDLSAAEQDARARGEKELAKIFKRNRGRGAAVRLAVARVRKHLALREQGRYYRSELFGYSKRAFLSIGRSLVSVGALETASDIFFLQEEEITGYLDGSGPSRDLVGLVRLRKAEHEEAQKREPSREFTTRGIVAQSVVQETSAASADGPRDLQGIGSSPGVVQGVARIVLEPSLTERLDEDVILIARQTDPGWLYLMLQAKGLAVERGSMLSHTAITGRRLGIPTVVAVEGLTARVTDGARIELDGASGRITLLDELEGQS